MSTLKWAMSAKERDAFADKLVKKHGLWNDPSGFSDAVEELIIRTLMGDKKVLQWRYTWHYDNPKRTNDPYNQQQNEMNKLDSKYHEEVSLVLLAAIKRYITHRIEVKERRRERIAAANSQ